MGIVHCFWTKKALVLFCTTRKMEHACMSVHIRGATNMSTAVVEGHMMKPPKKHLLNASGLICD